MKRHVTLVSLLVVALMVAGIAVGWAQLGENAQRARAGLTNVMGARTAGMGGAAIAAPEPGTALYWNPAALALQRGTRLYGSIGGSAEGIDTAEDLADVVEIIDDAPSNFEDLGEDDYFTIRDIIKGNEDQPIRGELGMMGSFEINNFALGYWVIAGGDAGVEYTDPAQNGDIESVSWEADAAGQGGAGIAYGKRLSDSLNVGVTARMA
ncbi:MAG: hypothetical protein ACOC7J_03035, partial [Armatimonadota bacterium]